MLSGFSFPSPLTKSLESLLINTFGFDLAFSKISKKFNPVLTFYYSFLGFLSYLSTFGSLNEFIYFLLGLSSARYVLFFP